MADIIVDFLVDMSAYAIVDADKSIGTFGCGSCVGIIAMLDKNKVFCGHMANAIRIHNPNKEGDYKENVKILLRNALSGYKVEKLYFTSGTYPLPTPKKDSGPTTPEGVRPTTPEDLRPTEPEKLNPTTVITKAIEEEYKEKNPEDCRYSWDGFYYEKSIVKKLPPNDVLKGKEFIKPNEEDLFELSDREPSLPKPKGSLGFAERYADKFAGDYAG